MVRDMVFAGLALLERGNEPTVERSNQLQADYTKSALQVYQECAESLIYGDTGLYTLSLVGDKRDGDLPTWVPDLSENLRPVPLRSLGGDAFAAFQTNDAPLMISISGSRLRLSTIVLDEIVTVGENYGGLMMGMGKSKDDSSLCFLSIISSLSSLYIPTGEPIMTAFWRTLLVNLFQSKRPAPSILSRSFTYWLLFNLAVRVGTTRMHDSWRKRAQYGLFGLDSKSAINPSQEAQFWEFILSHESPEYALEEIWEDLSEDMRDGNSENADIRLIDIKFMERTQPFASALNKSYEGRRIFLTKKGYIGLGPESI